MKRRRTPRPVTEPTGPVRARFAPSPTGDLHLGSAMVAIANRALASRPGDTLVLRVDDTDAARSTETATAALLETLAWLELAFDEGPVHQASLERAARHAAVVGELLASDAAYPCFCDEQRLAELASAQQAVGQAPRYDGRCAILDADEVAARRGAGERPAVRLRVDAARDWSFDDLVHGAVAGPPGSFGDFVIARSDGSATYLLASVVDDADLDITHVVRGGDHLANTPRQLALFTALGQAPPAFAHLPLLLGADGRKLSKRESTGSVATLRGEGVQPGAIRTLCWELLGQATGADACDPFGVGGAASTAAAHATFAAGSGSGWAWLELARVPRSSPHVERARLASLGVSVVKELPLATLVTAVTIDLGLRQQVGSASFAVPRERLAPLVDDLRGDLESPAEIAAAIVQLFEPSADAIDLPANLAPYAAIVCEADLDDAEGAAGAVRAVRARTKVEGAKLGEVLRPLRRTLTGTDHGPRLDAVLHALGSAEVARRLG